MPCQRPFNTRQRECHTPIYSIYTLYTPDCINAKGMKTSKKNDLGHYFNKVTIKNDLGHYFNKVTIKNDLGHYFNNNNNDSPRNQP